MKISTKKTDDLNQVLTLNIAAEDYLQAYNKKLKDVQHQAEAPGFRKGKVPASLIEKWYGERALVEAVNDVATDAIQKHIDDKKLDLIGEPLPVEEKLDIEWKAGNDFTFKYDMALTPQVDVEFDKKDEIPSYSITVSETEKNKIMEMYRAQQETARKNAEKAGKEAPDPMSEEDITKMADEQLKSEYKQAALFRLDRDIRDLCVKKANLTVPEKFLRRWLIAVNEGKFTPEQIDKDFAAFVEDYKWQLVMGALCKKFGIKLEKSDIKKEARNFVKYQYASYGIANLPEKMLDEFAEDMMLDQSNIQRLVENAQNRKVIDAVREKITLKSKRISADKFREL